MKNIHTNSISDLIINFSEIETLLLTVDEMYFDKTLETILSSIFVSSKDYYYILLLSINFIMQSRPHKLKYYEKILLSLKKDFLEKNFFQDENELIKIFMFNEIALFYLGIDKSKDYIMQLDHHARSYPVPFCYNPRKISEDLFEKSIREDDIEIFQNLISRTNKDIRSYVACPSINVMGYFPHINLNRIEFISYSAFYGSLHIFKFLWMHLNSMNENNQDTNRNENENRMPSSLVVCAIAGGNYEIIHILDELIQKDDFSLIAAIRFFQFELIDYLLENYDFQVGINELLTSIQCHNFKFFIDNCQKVLSLCNNNDDFINVVLFCSESCNAVALNYISDVLHFDITQSSVKSNLLIESALKESINILRFIFFDNVFSLNYDNKNFSGYKKTPLFDVNLILSDFPDFDGLAILHLVVSMQLLNTAKFFFDDELLSRISIDWNVKDSTNATPLHWSILVNNFEMFTLLLSHSNYMNKNQKQIGYVDVNAVNSLGQNILHIACSNNNNEILKFILENEIIDPKTEDNEQENIIHYAARNGNCDIFGFSCIRSLPKDVFIKKNGFKSRFFHQMAFTFY